MGVIGSDGKSLLAETGDVEAGLYLSEDFSTSDEDHLWCARGENWERTPGDFFNEALQFFCGVFLRRRGFGVKDNRVPALAVVGYSQCGEGRSGYHCSYADE